MKFTNKFKHLVLQHYLWITAFLFGLSLLAVVTFAARCEDKVKFLIIGAPVTFVFFVQKQKLEETRLFKELFNEFNARYNSLNNDLNRIRTDSESIRVIPADRDVLYKYFNLCAEEHLFYSRGYIPEDVWRSWWEGMTIFFDCPRIRQVWDGDTGRNSYFGFVPPKPVFKTPSARDRADDVSGSESTDQRAAA